jgi:hypothetical protein
MPLLAPPGVGLPPVEPPVEPPPAGAGSVFEVISLTLSRDDQTLELPLTNVPGHPWQVGPGVEGLDLPASKLLQERAASQFGSFHRGVDVDARDVFLPVMVRAASMSEWLELRATYNQLTSPYHGRSTRITATRPDNSQRWVDGFRVGDAPDWSLDNWIPRILWQKFGQTFVCPDPWWHSTADVYGWSIQPSVSGFFPLLPVNLSTSLVGGTPITIVVRGDIGSFPRFEIQGAATQITAQHVESGREWTLVAPVAGGANPETVIIDTDPRLVDRPIVEGPDGSSWFKFLEPPYDLWTLPIGSQTVLVTALGADASTQVRLLVPPLWETA